MPKTPVKLREPVSMEDKEFNTRNTPEVQDQWIRRLNEMDLDDEYAQDFISNMDHLRKVGYYLSENQAALLEKLHVKY